MYSRTRVYARVYVSNWLAITGYTGYIYLPESIVLQTLIANNFLTKGVQTKNRMF